MEIPFGYVENDTLYRASFGATAPLKLCDFEQETLEKTVSGFITNFEKLQKRLEAIISKIEESNNKGSFLSALLSIKSSIEEHSGLGDYANMLHKIEQYENLLVDFIAKNRQKNTEIKQALLLELEVILANNDFQEAFEQIKDLKQRWIKTGGVEEEVKEEIEGKFKEGLDQFFEKRKSFMDAKNLLKQARVEDYQRIIDEIAAFVKAEDYYNSFDRVKQLQTEWKDSGRIPEESFKKLNDAYWKVCQSYFEQQKIVKTKLRKEQGTSEKDTVKKRDSIIAEMQRLAVKAMHVPVKKELDALTIKWNNAGRLSKGKFDEVKDKFYEVTRAIDERQFVLSQTKRKNREFDQKTESEKLQLLTRSLIQLLKRDEEELQSFTENMDKMHINKGSFVTMLENKLSNQRNKVEMKRNLLTEYQNQVKSLKNEKKEHISENKV